MKRRTFIQAGTAVSGASYLGFPLIKSKQDQKFRLVIIGCGWWGTNILREAVKSGRVEVVGICDVDQRQLQTITDEINGWNGSKPKWYTDYRECISETNPEIAIVATPDHWHALPMIEAVNAGAHVYVEKPISHTILEGRAMFNAARQNDRVVQVGTHRRTSPHNISAQEFLHSGKVGKISMVKCFVNYGGNAGEPTPDAEVPEGLDWDMWLGPAPYRDYNPRIHPRGFRSFLDYANGTISDWGIHWFDQVLWWSEQQVPSRVFSTGGRFVKEDHTDVPDTQLATFEFEDFSLYWEHKLAAKNAYEDPSVGCYFYGTNGTLHVGWRDGWTFFPSTKGGEKVHVEPTLHQPDDQNIRELWADFMKSIDEGSRPTCDIEKGYLATNLSLLAMISLKAGRSLEWDGTTILNDKEAQAMMKRTYRDPWDYPDYA